MAWKHAVKTVFQIDHKLLYFYYIVSNACHAVAVAGESTRLLERDPLVTTVLICLGEWPCAGALWPLRLPPWRAIKATIAMTTTHRSLAAGRRWEYWVS